MENIGLSKYLVFFCDKIVRISIMYVWKAKKKGEIMTTTRTYIKEWQLAIQKEINHLKKFGGNRFLVQDGRLLSSEGPYHYYFDTNMQLGIPVASTIKL